MIVSTSRKPQWHLNGRAISLLDPELSVDVSAVRLLGIQIDNALLEIQTVIQVSFEVKYFNTGQKFLLNQIISLFFQLIRNLKLLLIASEDS